MYFAPFGDVTLIGASPETFIRVEGGTIAMRPIAGTVRRGATADEDAILISALREDEKERAEHIMLVDLCRNDIGRVCVPGTLRVDELMVVEGYSHVSHLVSHVAADVRRGVDVYDAIAATFPAGTMTGAPKVRAMEIIAELEITRRGIYAGAVGVIDFGGYANLALCIRSATHSRGHYRLRASAGVVADSKAENEWRETLKKMGAVYWAVTGEELGNEGLVD
jgi:anthranilate synthase component 1